MDGSMDSSTHPSRRSAGFQHTYESFEIFPEEAQIKPRSRRVDILNPLRAVISESDFQFFERFGPALKKKKKKKLVLLWSLWRAVSQCIF